MNHQDWLTLMLIAVLGLRMYKDVWKTNVKAMDTDRNTQAIVDAIHDLERTFRGEE
jgi:hypothetical protein